VRLRPICNASVYTFCYIGASKRGDIQHMAMKPALRPVSRDHSSQKEPYWLKDGGSLFWTSRQREAMCASAIALAKPAIYRDGKYPAGLAGGARSRAGSRRAELRQDKGVHPAGGKKEVNIPTSAMKKTRTPLTRWPGPQKKRYGKNWAPRSPQTPVQFGSPEGYADQVRRTLEETRFSQSGQAAVSSNPDCFSTTCAPSH